jgi:acetylornithine/succinyldiaminopimelate/putrescine aminotransferase
MLAGVRDQGAYLRNRLEALKEKFPVIKEIRGLGLMWGLELAVDGAPVVSYCREHGLLVNYTQGNVIRLLPPLVITEDELNRGLSILAGALQSL